MGGNFVVRVRCRRAGCRFKILIDERLLERGTVERTCRCGALNRWDGRKWVLAETPLSPPVKAGGERIPLASPCGGPP